MVGRLSCAGWVAVGLAVASSLFAGTACAQVMPAQPSVRSPGGEGAWSAEVKSSVGSSARSQAIAIRLTGDAKRTSVRLEVTLPIVASIFTLDAPYRAVIDIPDLDFKLPPTAGARGQGLVAAFRYGQFQATRSRVVIDLVGPARVENAAFAPPSGKQVGVLTFDLVRVSAAEFTANLPPASFSAPEAQLRGGRHDEVAATPMPSVEPPAKGPKLRPVVVIDPGHGGIDPGAVASPALTEKMVTLAVATQVRSLLVQNRRFDVHLTRQTDAFVSLDQRLRLSRQYAADLFVSIHADALGEQGLAQSVRGATVYVLSDRASDDAARRLAEKENAADVLAGLAAMPASVEDQVRSILLDLVQRETANFSARFRGLVVNSLQTGKIPLAKDPQRSAAFKVLKQPETPAVLIELGYMSNSEDLLRLGKPEGQRQLAASITAAIEAYFAKRDASVGR